VIGSRCVNVVWKRVAHLNSTYLSPRFAVVPGNFPIAVDTTIETDCHWMQRALEFAARGTGRVEPNPPVGCVIVHNDRLVGKGWHARFGGPHAEIVALAEAGEAARGATLYVTLEPCCHHGKTPPCTEAIMRAGVARVVIALEDPFPQVQGGGVRALTAAGVSCQVGARAEDARRLLAPYLKLVTTGRPWVIAKWAMTLDGKLATESGNSQWISSDASRETVHQLRGRMDAILVGSGTARMDNPLLTARPQEPGNLHRIASRVVFDSTCSLPITSQLVTSISQAPLIVAASAAASADRIRALTHAGAEVLRLVETSHAGRLLALLDELGRRRMTNLLAEGGSRLLGLLFDTRAVDEVHVFIAPKLIGGHAATSPVGGAGIHTMSDAMCLDQVVLETRDGDIYLRGRSRWNA
jgi:diaminohydroxyphosphoribosylaminopyrimidine deaminase/5-amino-6-(5-phosphoribosylamino)uracil reductase